MEKRKVYVEVLAAHQINGECVPMSISFENGVEYKIDRVRSVERVAAVRPTLRYTVIVEGKQTFLYLEEDVKWFVHLKGQAKTVHITADCCKAT